jgi:hypothetical protein
MSLKIVHMKNLNMLEMSATCHDRSVPCVMIEEFHTSELMDAPRLWFFEVQELLNSKYGYLMEGRTHEVIGQLLSLINPRLRCV